MAVALGIAHTVRNAGIADAAAARRIEQELALGRELQRSFVRARRARDPGLRPGLPLRAGLRGRRRLLRRLPPGPPRPAAERGRRRRDRQGHRRGPADGVRPTAHPRGHRQHDRGPAEALERTNRVLLERRASLFITALCASLDPLDRAPPTGQRRPRAAAPGAARRIAGRAAARDPARCWAPSPRSTWSRPSPRSRPATPWSCYTDGVTDARVGDRRALRRRPAAGRDRGRARRTGRHDRRIDHGRRRSLPGRDAAGRRRDPAGRRAPNALEPAASDGRARSPPAAGRRSSARPG